MNAILAAMIVVVDSIVNNYGEVKIDINNGKKELKVNGGASLLTTLSEQGIFIPSACGGRGSCGACKVKVLSDIGPILPTEAPLLDDEEIKQNIRLSCQVKVKSNIAIEIPEELFSAKIFKGVFEKINDLTYDIKEVKIKLVEPNEIEFKAGQYMQLVIPPYEKIKEFTQRAYLGIFRKVNLRIKNLDNKEELLITELSLHLIEKHHFFQGKGSAFRVEPEKLKKVLEELPTSEIGRTND